VQEVERPLISICLAATRGNQIRAAHLLGLNRNTLRKKIRDLGLEVIRGMNIGSSCTGTLTTTDSNSVVRHYFVVLSGIKRAALKIVDTDNGLTLSGDARAQGVGICGFTGKGSAYAENLSGFVGSVPEAIVGRVGTNGSGTISFGFNARALGGVVNTNPISGSYTVNSNCTGTAQIVFGIKSYNFTYVAVDAGKQYILLETDANTTVAGALTTE
jgi:hypothetical protein